MLKEKRLLVNTKIILYCLTNVKRNKKACQTTGIVIKIKHNQAILIFCHRYKKGKLGNNGAKKTQKY